MITIELIHLANGDHRAWVAGRAPTPETFGDWMAHRVSAERRGIVAA
jgi:hypothetical protein